jgi:hypothetical protein
VPSGDDAKEGRQSVRLIGQRKKDKKASLEMVQLWW